MLLYIFMVARALFLACLGAAPGLLLPVHPSVWVCCLHLPVRVLQVLECVAWSWSQFLLAAHFLAW
jgi:hypothetical protein